MLWLSGVRMPSAISLLCCLMCPSTRFTGNVCIADIALPAASGSMSLPSINSRISALRRALFRRRFGSITRPCRTMPASALPAASAWKTAPLALTLSPPCKKRPRFSVNNALCPAPDQKIGGRGAVHHHRSGRRMVCMYTREARQQGTRKRPAPHWARATVVFSPKKAF